jgi:hypothetical protein
MTSAPHTSGVSSGTVVDGTALCARFYEACNRKRLSHPRGATFTVERRRLDICGEEVDTAMPCAVRASAGTIGSDGRLWVQPLSGHTKVVGHLSLHHGGDSVPPSQSASRRVPRRPRPHSQQSRRSSCGMRERQPAQVPLPGWRTRRGAMNYASLTPESGGAWRSDDEKSHPSSAHRAHSGCKHASGSAVTEREIPA